MANPQTFLQLSLDYFKRNNPVEAVLLGLAQNVYNMITFRSRLKLLQYRKMLEFQKLERIENTLSEASPYEIRGNKIDRIY